ncbi:MAG: Zn-dependent oligopeptidase [Bacteroidota bacterium]|nr:Zn-dependent oligopeptidase [Bacteroidota bacterium]
MALLFGSMLLVGADAHQADDSPFLSGISSTEDFSKSQAEHLTKAKTAMEQLVGVKGKRSIENTLKPYDEILIHLDAVSNQANLIENVHPTEAMRKTAEEFSQKAAAFGADLSLNRAVYDALTAMDISSADAKTKFYVEKTLRDFRLSGVDKDEPTRNKIKALRDELVLIGQDFSRNIREDVRTVKVTDVKELEGLPQDYIDRHKPDSSGVITLTINYPDAVPVFTYAKNEQLRKRMYMEYNNRAYPKNIEVLNTMIAKRDELAKLLDFPNWAACVTADKMVGSEKNASDFIEKIAAASTKKSEIDYKQLLARKQKDVPNATEVNPWESGYYSELVRKSDYSFDAQTVRPYFQYDKVKQGVLDVYSKLFSVEFRSNKTAPVWHSSVECYDMYESGTLVGRFYFDMHPRKDKYNHAAQFGIRNGVAGKQIPEAALICNFPGGEKNDPGLMEHGDVETFFHEFGHLLHHLFAGRQPWIGVAGISCEWDFVEAPSQLLEEWAWDAATLQTFAKHYQTNEPIPAALVQNMRRADEFGKGLQVRQQMFYAKLSLSCYDNDPKNINTDQLIKTLRERYTPYKHVEGTHLQTSFGHLDGYSAIYYTYMWSLVIAKDFFSKFNSANLLDPVVAKKYRDTVLAPGGSLPAQQLVKNFMGRDFNFESWKKWLEN